MSALLLQRVKRKNLHSKITTTEKLVPEFKDGMYLGWSGFTGVGYPKEVTAALANHVEMNNLQGKMQFHLFVGASTSAETEDRWAKLGMISHRTPYQVGKNIQKGINNGQIKYFDKHLSEFPQDLIYGYYTKDKPNKKLDIAILEASGITENGEIIPTASVGASPELAEMADKLIVEVNTAYPDFSGLHDITTCSNAPKPPILVSRVDDRIGSLGIRVDPDKIIGIVESTHRDNTPEMTPADEMSEKISQHIIDFLLHEAAQGRLPKHLHPIQSGIGNIANAVVHGLAHSPFRHVQVWTEVVQDGFIDFIDAGKLDFVSATSMKFSPHVFDKVMSKWDFYRKKIILRNQSVSNSPEVIRRLGVIALNTPVEFDIYGHLNSTMKLGSQMINGLGGSGDFFRNAKLSIAHTPSTRPSKTDPTGISCLVPFCSHIDHTEHDIDIYVTEQGLADVRGMSPKERAEVIIDKCAHPDYKPQLKEYVERANKFCLAKGMGHEPHLLGSAFKMHTNFIENGTMKLKSWD